MKYFDFLKINDTFQYSINLQFDIGNINKIKEYIPTTDSCKVMEYYFDAILGNFNKSTILIGPYGKGKSHLLLVALTLLSDYSKDDEIAINNLINKIKNIDKSLYDKITKVRNNKLKFLPVIINSNYNNMNQAFLLALYEALEREHMKDINIDSYYTSALKVIERWEEDRDKEILKKFDECLQKNSTSIENLKLKLGMFDEEGYEDFKQVYKCVMHGVDFNPIINSDIVKYYKDVNYKINQMGYNGILIIFDEFSKFLEYVGNENIMRDLKIIQDFAEVASRTGKSEQILFTCITHKTINEYMKNLKDDKINALKAVEGRFKEIYFNRSMEQNYEIISQTINRTSDAEEIIQEEIDKKKEFYNSLMENFRFCKFDKVEEVLFKGCYPLNPVTVFSVINLSERVAQNERTLFTFLTDDDPNSFKYFIKNSEKNDLFNTDKVYDYFYNILRKENDEKIKKIWIKVENALSKTQEQLERRILKSLAIIYMINDFDDLMPNEENLRLSVNANKKEFNNALNSLMEKSLIKQKKANKLFDFSTVYNKQILNEIDRIAESKFKSINIKENLTNIIDLGYVIPRRYNQTYKMTRFFKQIFITEEEFLNLKSLKVLEQNYFSDGYILNILRTSNNIEKLLDKTRKFNDDSTIIRIPKESISNEMFEALSESAAIEYIKRTENNDEETIREINIIEDDIIELIQNEIDKKYDNENIKCLAYMDKVINSEKLNSICSEICKRIYSETPVINNEMINKEQLSKPITKARAIVIDSILNNSIENIKSDTSAEATIYKAVVSKKDNEDIRKIINIIKRFIKETEKTGKRNFEKLQYKLVNKPYGIRKGILPILLSIGIQEYSENIVLYYQNKEIDVNSNNISKIFDEPYKYYLYVEKGTEQKIKFVQKLSKIFNSTYTELERNNIKELVIKMRNWALGLPRITREIYEKNQIIDNEGYLLIKNQLLKEDLNNNEFLFEFIPKSLKDDNYNKITEEITRMKTLFDHYIDLYIESIIKKFKEEFKHNTKLNLNSLLKDWYKNLNNNVKKSVVGYETKKVFEYIENLDNFNEVGIFQNFSNIFLNFYVEDWQKNSENEFFEKLENMFEDIKSISNIDKSKQETVVITTGRNELRKYINNSEISSLGNTLKNNIEDSIDEYGDSISESEKIKILLEIVKKFM